MVTDSCCWGKTWRRQEPALLQVHRLEHHCLDVLATLDALFARDPGLQSSLVKALLMPDEAAVRLARWCTLLHDAGKVAKAFQAKARIGWMRMRGDVPLPRPLPCAHDMVGFQVMLQFLDDAGDLGNTETAAAARIVIAAGFFHHGRPRTVPDFVDPAQFSERHDMPRFTGLVASADRLVGRPEWPTLEGAIRASWLLTGIVSLVDGLGSAVSDRIMEAGATVPSAWIEDGTLRTVPWRDYLDVVARPQADLIIKDVAETAFAPLPVPPPCGNIEVLAGMAGMPPERFIPSPLQSAACDIPLEGQFVAIIEDVTGSGKTEASAMLVRRAIQAGIAQGGYWGLPTMATANGLYGRFRHIVHFLHGGDPSLVLAHGAKEDVPLFRRALRNVLGEPVIRSSGQSGDDGATCLDWLTEGSHRTLLAHCGVGTIDQALFAGLNSYHCGMRWVGLHRKVLVADEVHAADPGMLEILCKVLRHHAALGGSAIMMSATLPSATRARLLDSFGGGAEWPVHRVALDRVSYPLLTLASAAETSELALATRQDRHGARHQIRRIGSADEAAGRLAEWSRQRRCAVWFRNTVGDAVGAYRDLRRRGVPVLLFHSRFTRARRAEIEQEVLRRFGPVSRRADRAGRILVSTQVAEQSLDIDLDEAVLDLAPADLLLQRLGRRRRHRRDAQGSRLGSGDDGRPEQSVLLLSPDPDDVRAEAWLSAVLPGTAFVYPDTARMWRSAALLLQPSTIPQRMPGLPEDFVVPHLDARPLMEAVYPPDEHALRRLAPAPLRESVDRAWGADRIEKDDALARSFDFTRGYLPEAETIAGAFEDVSAMTATRNGDGGTVYLAVWREGWSWLEPGGMMQSAVPVRFNLRPHASGEQASKEICERRSRDLRERRLGGEEAQRARRELRMLEADRRPCVVAMQSSEPGELSGAAIRPDGREVRLAYDSEHGLREVSTTS